jgi:hypothetical protein
MSVSRLQDPFFLVDGSRPLYFRHGATEDLDAARDEVFWMRSITKTLSEIQPRVRQFHQNLSSLIEQFDRKFGDMDGGGELLRNLRCDLSTLVEACNRWLVDFECTHPVPKLEKLVEAGETIVAADVEGRKHIDLDRLLLREAALQGMLEIQVRSLLCEAPDECKDVEACERLLDWQKGV